MKRILGRWTQFQFKTFWRNFSENGALWAVLLLGVALVNFFLLAKINSSESLPSWVESKDTDYLVSQSLNWQLQSVFQNAGLSQIRPNEFRLLVESVSCKSDVNPLTNTICVTSKEVLSRQVEEKLVRGWFQLKPVHGPIEVNDMAFMADLNSAIFLNLLAKSPKGVGARVDSWLPMTSASSEYLNARSFIGSLSGIIEQSVSKLSPTQRWRFVRSFNQRISKLKYISIPRNVEDLDLWKTWWISQSQQIISVLGLDSVGSELQEAFLRQDLSKLPLVRGDFEIRNRELTYILQKPNEPTRLMPSGVIIQLPSRSEVLVTQKASDDFANFDRILFVDGKADLSDYIKSRRNSNRWAQPISIEGSSNFAELRGEGIRQMNLAGQSIGANEVQEILQGQFRSLEYSGQPVKAFWNRGLRAYRISGVVDVVAWVRPNTFEPAFHDQIGM